LGLYGALLDVAAKRPQLFLGDARADADKVTHKLFTEVLGLLKGSDPPFDREVGTALAGVVLNAAAARAALLAQSEDEWRKTALEILAIFTTNLSATLRANEKLKEVFSGGQVTELGRILVSRLAAAPAMVLGSDTAALESVLKAITAPMAADQHVLLSGDDWLEIVAVAAEEAAANPARLFTLNPSDPSKVLAGQLIGVVLNAASEAARDPNTGSTAILHGKTLREAIVVMLRAASGKPDAIRMHMAKVEALVKELNELIAGNAQRLGSKEWLHLFRILLPSALEGHELPSLDLAGAEELLKGGL